MKTILPIIISLLLALPTFSQPKLSSFPEAGATIFLDFDGQFVEGTPWNGGQPFYCTNAGLSNAQITEVFHRVAEDYRPFQINITTDSTVFLAAPLTQRIRVIVTLTSDWYQGVGGVAFTRSFTWGDGTPAFVFPDRLARTPKYIAECCTHESGHTLGLSHQAKYNGACNLVSTYNNGIGSGQTGWAPVMGNSYSRNFSGWNNGPTPSGCMNDQDNLSIITGVNGFTYREDDYGNAIDQSPEKMNLINNNFSREGIITTNTDKDVFLFDLEKDGRLKINAHPFSVGTENQGANLDIKFSLLDSDGNTLRTFDPKDILNVAIDTFLPAGKYFGVIAGTGNIYASNYGSLGSYTIEGAYTASIVMAVHQIELSGRQVEGIHQLRWNIEADEALKNIQVETSSDGVHFKDVAVLSPAIKTYIYQPVISGELLYRLKVTTAVGKEYFSNVITLHSNIGNALPKVLSNVVRNQIKVRSSKAYQFILTDITGKILKKGNVQPGMHVINLENAPKGMYFLQCINNSQKTTQRILKL